MSTISKVSIDKSQEITFGKHPKQDNAQKEIVQGELVHPGWNNFFKVVNGVTKDPSKLNYFSPLYLAKAIWPVYLPLQLIGLVNKQAHQIAKGVYGAIWSVVYTCLRPLKNDRDQLSNKNAQRPIPDIVKKLFNINEHFRLIGGLVISLVYGTGAFKMLWGALTGNEDLYESASNLYFKGMNDQIAEFGSMNLERVLKRKYNPLQLLEADRPDKGVKANVELIDALSFPITTITRILETSKMFGVKLGDGLQRFINAIGYTFYGTWATKFGILKSLQEKGGDLEPINPNLKGTRLEKADRFLYETQKYGGKTFHTLLPTLSWVSAAAELLGFSNFAQKTFELEGYAERLNPKIAAWCIRSTWFQWFSDYFNAKKRGNNGKN